MERLFELIRLFLTEHGRIRRYRRILSGFLACVVFITTYALILPALTLDAEEAAEQPGITVESEQPEDPALEPEAAQEADTQEAQEDTSEDSQEQSAQETQVDPAPVEQEETALSDPAASDNPTDPEADPAHADAVAQEEAEEQILITDPTTLTYEGEDFVVTASFDASAKFPQGVEMQVTEIRSEVPEKEHKEDAKAAREEEEAYQAYYGKALEAVKDESGKEQDFTHARFFDISFFDGDHEIEPVGPVSINIKYDQGVKVTNDQSLNVLHFVEDEKYKGENLDKAEVQILPETDIETNGTGKNADNVSEITFATDSFSVYGVVYTVEFQTQVLTASGDIYDVRVVCGEDAHIPENAELQVKEIKEEEEAYIQFQKDVEADTHNMIRNIPSHPILFDISLWADGERIEPAEGSSVKVEVSLVKDAVRGMFFDEDAPLLVNDAPIPEERTDINKSLQVIHQVEQGQLEVMDTENVISEETVVSSFETGSFSDWLLFLDETVENITIGRNDTLTLRPYSKWVWKSTEELEQYAGYKWSVPQNSNVISFEEKDKYDDQLRERYTYFHGTATQTGEFDIQLTDNGNVVHTIHVTVVNDVEDIPPVIQDTEDLTVNLFDYDINTRDRTKSGSLDSQSNVASNPSNTSVNSNHDLKFLGYGGGNVSGWSINNYTQDKANPGILEGRLSNGYPKVNHVNHQSLDYLFDTTSRNNSVYAYPDVNGLFQKDSDGYYYYNSNSNYAYYDPSNGNKQITLYQHTYSQWTSGSAGANAKPIGFFPFHKYDSYLKEGNTGMNFNTNLNHHFGMSMTVDFEIPSDGLDDYGNPISFEFSGDDDMWVFIDDNLVLDVGGIHQPVTGKINFSSDKVSVFGQTDTTITQKFIDAGSPTPWEIGDGKPHTMKVFYLERGGCDSNLSLKFNTPKRFGKAKLSLVKRENGKTVGLPNAKFKLWDNAKCEGEPIGEYTTDEDGMIRFNDFVLKSGTDTFYLKEVESPNGYILDTNVYQIKPRLNNNGDVVKDSSGDYVVLDILDADGNALTKLENGAVVFPNDKIGKVNIPAKKTWVGGEADSAVITLTINRYKLIDKSKGFMIIKEVLGEPDGYVFDAIYTITYPDGHQVRVPYSDFHDGIYSIEDGDPGSYIIEESVLSTAPNGYHMTHSTQHIEVTLEEDGTAQANFRTEMEPDKGTLLIKATETMINGSSSDIDYSKVRYAVLDSSGKKVTSITHAEAATGKALELPVGEYSVKAVSVPKTPVNYDLIEQNVTDGSKTREGVILNNISVYADRTTQVDYQTTYVKKNNAQNCRYKISDTHISKDYKTGKIEYPVGTKLRMSFQVPRDQVWGDMQVTYNGSTLNGDRSNVQSNYEYSVEFTVVENAELVFKINGRDYGGGKNVNISGPTFELVGTTNSLSNSSSRKLMSAKRAPASNSLRLSVTNTAKHPDAPTGKKYVKDSEWSATMELSKGGNWQDTLENQPASDIEGNKYYYYVSSVNETGLPDGTVCTIDLDGENIRLIGEDSPSGTILGVTNKMTGSLAVEKEVTVNESPVSDHTKASPADGDYTFTVTKKGDASFEAQTITLTVVNGESISDELTYLDPGTYIVTEEEASNGTELFKINGETASGRSAEVVVEAGKIGENAAKVTFTNNITQAELTIYKIRSDTKIAITGAKFVLTRVDEQGTIIETEGTAYTSGELTVDDEGKILFSNLRKGRYKLEETFVPEGYVKKEGPFYFNVSSDGTATIEAGYETAYPKEGSAGNEFCVENEPGAALPNAGGPGTTATYAAGTILALFAGVFLAMRRFRQ